MTRSIDVDMRAAAWTESSAATRRQIFGARLIAGVSVPDSPLITEVLEYAQKLYEPYPLITRCDRGCSHRRLDI
jgi:hypothetical protein